MENTIKIMNVIAKFSLNLFPEQQRYRIETSSFIKYNFRTNDRIDNILKYEKEFQSLLGRNTWLEAKNGYISICIPKKKKDIYPINNILESDFYQNNLSELKIALGETPDGGMAIIDLKDEISTNILIGGTPGSGKSNLINIIINCLIQNNSDDVKLLLFDLKEGVELIRYNCLPNLLKPVITNTSIVEDELIYLVSEMNRRYYKIKNAGYRNLKEYRKKLNDIPYLVVIIDELAEIVLNVKDCENQLKRIAQKGRAAGIHLIIATQRPSVDIVNPIVKASMNTRIAFHVASNVDSRVILDKAGAEKLTQKGDMILIDDDEHRIQCCYISDEEIEGNIKKYKNHCSSRGEVLQLTYTPKLKISECDRLYQKAIELITKEKKCSAWLFMTKLNMGKPKANELIKRLQKEGYISDHKIGKNFKILKGD